MIRTTKSCCRSSSFSASAQWPWLLWPRTVRATSRSHSNHHASLQCLLTGKFVCKLFDTFLPFTVHLLLILKMHFTNFAIIKPNQSRPANSER